VPVEITCSLLQREMELNKNNVIMFVSLF
jgi:hypothetical protein